MYIFSPKLLFSISDGYLDIDKLLAGTDPNDYPGAVVTPTPTPTPPCFEAVFANFFLLRKPGKGLLY